MMSLDLDFVLPSCPGIPDSMWIAISSMITMVIKRCRSLLCIFITIRLLFEAIFEVSQGQFTPIPYARTLLHAFFVASFLMYYKPLLEFFDGFIGSLCNLKPSVLSEALAQGRDRFRDYSPEQPSFSFIRKALVTLFELIPKGLFLFTQKGAIYIMHYLKAVTLIIITCVGPLAALFSILPGPFKKGWSVWAHSYIHVTCWTITLNIFMALTNAFHAVSLLTESRSASTFFSENVGHGVLSLMLLFAIFLTPSWTSMFIGPAVMAPLGSILNQILTRLGPGGCRPRYWGKIPGRESNWVFINSKTGQYLLQLSWIPIRRHRMVSGRSSPDDPRLRGYWYQRQKEKRSYGITLRSKL